MVMAPAMKRSARVRPPLLTVAAPLTGRPATVADVRRETASSTTLVLEGDGLDFVPGQFFTVVVDVPGQPPLRRAYSASSFYRDRSRVAITVKRVPGGRASTVLTQQI